jgi:hypothetical protein
MLVKVSTEFVRGFQVNQESFTNKLFSLVINTNFKVIIFVADYLAIALS